MWQGVLHSPQIPECDKNCEAPSAAPWRRCKQGCRSAKRDTESRRGEDSWGHFWRMQPRTLFLTSQKCTEDSVQRARNAFGGNVAKQVLAACLWASWRWGGKQNRVLCSPLPSWLDATTPKAMVRRSTETVFQSLETQRTRPERGWKCGARLSLCREGMLGSLLAPRFPFLSLLV